jgi:uncharacterized protein
VGAGGSAPAGAARGPATVVVSQPLKRGQEEAVRHWQEDVDRTVSGFDGFLGNDVATSGDGEEWTVIYRFDSKPHLLSWLGSQERDQVISQACDLFDGPASQQVLIREHDADMVTVVITHPVDPADENTFLAWQQRVTEAERTFPGFQGAELFRPVAGVQPAWTALYRYDSDEHADAWLESDQRRDLLREGRRFQDFELRRISSPFGSWFAQPGEEEAGDAPANWKTALSVLVGLYPTVVLLTLAISEIWSTASLWQSLLLGNILSVGLLTWVVMPLVTRALRFWLVPGRGGFTARADVLGTAASVVFLTFAALIFWLCTTQIWHLP